MSNRSRPFWALALLGTVAVAACDDSPTEPDGHVEPESVELTLNGAVIATYDGDARSWTGEMEVEKGEETAHIGVRFLDEDGEEIEFDSDYYLMVEVEDETVAEFEQDSPGEFGGHLHGIASGETEVVFSLMHGAIGSGHEDFVTTGVHAHVHADPVGVELVLGGAVVASYDGLTMTWTGELEVDEGDETADIEVRFIDEDDDPIVFGDDYYLQADVDDETIAEFEQDEPGEFGGHLHGVMAGETEIVFSLMHGAVGSGHSDFETTGVHAHVN